MFRRIRGRGAPLLFPVLAFCFVPACGSGFSDSGDGGSSRDGSVTPDGGTSSEASPDSSPPPDATGHDASNDGASKDAGPLPFLCGKKTCTVSEEYCEEDTNASGGPSSYTCVMETCVPDHGCDCALAKASADPTVHCHVKTTSTPGECRIECDPLAKSIDGGPKMPDTGIP